MNNTLLMQLICTRISHDLSGTVGAIYNGTELLCEDLSFAEEASTLLQSSADNLMTRLKFFRQTFGLQNKDAPDVTADYLKTFSMSFVLDRPCQNALQRALIMTLTDLFYKGAKFTVRDNSIEAEGAAIKDVPALVNILEKGALSESANDAPALFAFFAADEMGKRLSFTKKENGVRIDIKDKQ